jgi:superfamily II DNA/RNA helicase
VRHKFNAGALHGDMDQPARMAALDAFRNGEAKLLVASDVAARGLDIPDVSHVFNFDVPHHPDDYVHRIGRTGRAGKSGTAITIVAPMDGKAVDAIEKLTGQPIQWMEKPAAAGSEPVEAPRVARPEHRERVERSHSRSRGEHRRHGGDTRPPQGRPRPPREVEEADTSHLPAFLLRPVPLKA